MARKTQQSRNSDGIDRDSHKQNANKQIRGRKNDHMDSHSVSKVKKTTTKTSVKYDNAQKYFVGIDLHKKFMQVAIMDPKGNVLQNKRIECNHIDIVKEFSEFPPNAKYVLESSSVWYGMYRFLTEKLHLDVMLSNPLATKRIAESKKKTDKVDARILADLLRGGYIAGCYVPEEKDVHNRQLVRYRSTVVKSRVKSKNSVHAILLQSGIKIKGIPFSAEHIQNLRKLNDWRIDKHIKTIAFLNDDVRDCDDKISNAVSKNEHASLLTTMPGIGPVTALTLSSEIGDISRFRDMGSLVAYFGLAPSVRNSASTVHHGAITKMGDSMVRQLLTECVLSHVQFAKNNNRQTPISVFYERLKEKRGVSKAQVAAAAKMLKIVFWMLTKNIDFWTCVEMGKKSTHRNPKKKK